MRHTLPDSFPYFFGTCGAVFGHDARQRAHTVAIKLLPKYRSCCSNEYLTEMPTFQMVYLIYKLRTIYFAGMGFEPEKRSCMKDSMFFPGILHVLSGEHPGRFYRQRGKCRRRATHALTEMFRRVCLEVASFVVCAYRGWRKVGCEIYPWRCALHCVFSVAILYKELKPTNTLPKSRWNCIDI